MTETSLANSETHLQEVPQKIANYLNKKSPLEGTHFEMNFIKALMASTQYTNFLKEIVADIKSAPIKAHEVHQILEKYFPRLPGHHVSVLNSDQLQEILSSRPAL